jgi:hypothetical protein
MSEIKRTRLNEEQMNKQISAVKKIVELTAQIKELLPEFEGKSVNLAYTNSVINLEKKNELYLKEKEVLTDEEKQIVKEAQQAALKAFREKKNTEISSDNKTGADETISEISKENVSEIKQEKKKGKKSH